MTSPILLGLGIAILLNMFVFIFAYKNQTDKLTDITYALTFALLAGFFWYTTRGDNSTYKITLLFMVVIWALRLGFYLFSRVLIKGRDHRFDEFRHIFKRYLRFWILQGTSVWVIAIPYIIGLTKSTEEVAAIASSKWVSVGMALWIMGFFIEAVADRQKFKFRLNPENEGKFMKSGLFSIVRFPNYTGEIMVWVGVFFTVMPLLKGLEWLSIISPLWIIFLLTSLSGIPFLERSNKRRYGDLPAFQEYKTKTKKLLPFIY